ncbi:MAG TPA: hypothetical protein VG815_07155 [Chloroflexota bacterium]|nr:hypothetical protein [Chloroflexota bacterium]
MPDDVGAALDVGSNTIRLLVARTVDGRLEPVLDDSRFVRLGSGVDASGRLEPARKDAGIQAILELAAQAREAGAADIYGVATSAIRDAADGAEYVRRIHDETGVEVRIIDGDEEARLTFAGATSAMDLSGNALVCDMGGGSCELIYASGSDIEWARSLQIGSGRLSERFIHHDPPTNEEQRSVEQAVESTLRVVGNISASAAAFTGGTASHVVYLLGEQGVSVLVTIERLERVESIVYASPKAEVARKYNVRPERAEILPAGFTALRTIALWSGAGQLSISRSGIREGLLLEAAGEHATAARSQTDRIQ